MANGDQSLGQGHASYRISRRIRRGGSQPFFESRHESRIGRGPFAQREEWAASCDYLGGARSPTGEVAKRIVIGDRTKGRNSRIMRRWRHVRCCRLATADVKARPPWQTVFCRTKVHLTLEARELGFR